MAVNMLSGSNIEQIVEFAKKSKKKKSDDNNSLAKFNVRKLEAIIKGVEDYPALVVSITGVYRSGKSFLINLMITYLRYLSENVSMRKLLSNLICNNLGFNMLNKCITILI